MREFFSYLWGRRTTVLGYIVTVLGVLATSDLFSEQTIKWFVLIIGVITAVLGHHNNAQAKKQSAQLSSDQGGFARPLMLALLLAISVASISVLPACTTSNPIREAETPEQKAYALYGVYVIAQGKAAALYKDPSVPESVRKSLKEANDRSYPVAERLVEATLEVSEIKTILNRCPEEIEDTGCELTNRKRLENAVTNLSTIYYTAQPVLLSLVATVKRAN